MSYYFRPLINFFTGIFFLLVISSCSTQQQTAATSAFYENKIENLIRQLHDPQKNGVLVAAHRCDWRNHPENSIPALKSSITMGVDIAEIDLKKTKDGVLILMHDKTIDRNTNGKGPSEDFTLEEIKKFRLRNGLGRVTDNEIPTFREFLSEAKGKILINIDKGYNYFPEVVQLLRETGTLRQAIINIDDNTTLDEVEQRFGKMPDDVMLMPVVVYKDKDKAYVVIKSYLRHKKTIFQPVWDKDKLVKDENFIALKKMGYGIWMNSLWPSLNGGHDDDKAIEENKPDETWGWLIKNGATVIQTDRPQQLLQYLVKKKLHPKF